MPFIFEKSKVFLSEFGSFHGFNCKIILIKRQYFVDKRLFCNYNVTMDIGWDPVKNEINKQKHGISFEEASKVFSDPLQVSILDERLNYQGERWITLGKILKEILVVVAHTYMNIDGKEIIRIISARKATKKERKQYEDY